MLHIVSWLWGPKWPAFYAERLFAGITRNLSKPHQLVLMSDKLDRNGADSVHLIDEADHQYLSKLGCLVRMRMFDKGWQERIGAKPGDLIVNVDIDCVITNSIDHLFGDDHFRIMQGFNTTNPCPFNGSLWTFRAGERHDVWNDFGPEAHKRLSVPVHAIPDDQGWLYFKFPDAKSYTPKDGVYCFKKKTWNTGLDLPENACIVAFPGRSPAKYSELKWIKKNWIS